VAHAIVILAHHLPGQLARLIDRVAGPDDHVWLHVDARQDIEPFRDLGATLLPRRPCPWGSVGIVEAALSGLEAAVTDGRDFSHVSLLSGQDYPIRPRAELDAHLQAHPTTGWLEWMPLPGPGPGDSLARVDRWHWHVSKIRAVSIPNRYTPFLPRRRPPLGLPIYKGSALFTITLAQAAHAVAFARENPRFVRFFKHAYIADEYVFQTILVNSRHRDDLVAHNLHAIAWHGGHHPATLTTADLPWLRASEGRFFARKFDVREDAAVLDLIDAELLARA
jgi:Core-2/I-Branching enzyme